MKNKLLFLLPFLLSSCSGPTNFDGEIKQAKELGKIIINNNDSLSLKSCSKNFNSFALEFMTQYFLKENKENNNLLLSPLTVYECFNFAKECANGKTQSEIDSLLSSCENIPQDLLYRAFNYDKKIESDDLHEVDQLTQILDNSIWIDNEVSYKQDCIDHLANDFYVSSYKTDFKNNPSESSQIINNYCFDKTNGFLNPGFIFDSDTYFTLISSYYLKALWQEHGSELPLTVDEYTFVNNDKSFKKTKLNQKIEEKRIFSNDQCSSVMLNDTTKNIGCYFIVPNQGYNIIDIMNKDNLSKVLSYDYSNDTETKYVYETTCLFPSFTIENNVSIREEISNLGVHDLFSTKCDFSRLTDVPVYCNDVQHVNKIEVGRRGIEGASITAMVMCGTAYVEDKRIKIQQNFVVDKSFGFVITSMNIPTFIGIVNKL